MPHMEPIEIVKRLLLIVLAAAIVTSWSWLIWSLFTGRARPSRTTARRSPPMPWHAGTILLVFVCMFL